MTDSRAVDVAVVDALTGLINLDRNAKNKVLHALARTQPQAVLDAIKAAFE